MVAVGRGVAELGVVRAAAARRGASSLGCLVSLLVVAALGYFGVKVGEVYYDFYTFQDRMVNEANFAAHRTDTQIRVHLVALADSLGLPPSAQIVNVRRVKNRIFIWANYYIPLEVPGYVREFHFSPQAKATF